jgi:DNA gyrase subunit A
VTDPDATDVLLLTRKGQAIRFRLDEDQLRRMGRPASGNMGIRLVDDDVVVDALLLGASSEGTADDEDDSAVDDEVEHEAFEDGAVRLLIVTEGGYGKRTSTDDFRPQNRNGKGIRAHRIDAKSGEITGGALVIPDDSVMVVTDTGRVIRFHARSVPIYSRYSRGVRIMRLEDDERLVDLARLEEDEDDDEGVTDDEEVGDGVDAETDSEDPADDADGDDGDEA